MLHYRSQVSQAGDEWTFQRKYHAFRKAAYSCNNERMPGIHCQQQVPVERLKPDVLI
jgi:hypothetical protein